MMDSFSLSFNPVAGEIDFALSNHHNSQTMRRRPGAGRQYKRIFQGIDPPKYTEDTQYTKQELEELIDCRFYIAIKAASGFCFQLQCLDGGKLYSLDKEIAPFPTLSEIIRLQLHRGLENDTVCRVRELVYDSTRSEFLQEILYPEICSQLDLYLTKFKLSTQLIIATRELQYRTNKNRQTESSLPTPTVSEHPHTSFSVMTDNELSAWIENMEKFVRDRRLKLSSTKPQLNVPSNDVFAIPVKHNSAFRYSFVRHDDRIAIPTAFLIAKARNFRKQANFLSATIELAKICPHKVCPISSPNEFELENIDCVRSLLCFLSYGFFDALNYA